jgi:hypothetical protein
MVDWSGITASAAAAAVAVTLWIFIVESHGRRVAERARLKREAISRLLDSMESSIRKNHGLLAALRFWENPDIGYALAIPRLIHDLGPSDRLVSAWAMSQVQAIIAATSDKRAAALGTSMSTKLVEWGQGKVSNDWFAQELRSHPIDPAFNVEKSARFQRAWHRLIASSFASLALFVIVGGSLSALKQIRGIAAEAVNWMSHPSK